MFVEPDERMKRVDSMEAEIIDGLGEAGALEAITRALDYDTKEDIYSYIIRVYDLESNPEE